MKLDIYLVIGLTKESRHWSNEFLDALKAKFDPHSIQLVDLPGSGKFLRQKSPASIEKIVDHARAQLTFHPGHQRVIIAVSMGGMTAWSWVNQHPKDFTHLVLINSSLGNLSPFWKRAQPKAILQFIRIAATPKGKKKEQHVLDLCSNNEKNASKIHHSWTKIGEEANMSLMNTIRQLVAAIKFKPEHAPQIPMLVIGAKHDRLAHFSCSELIANHASQTTNTKLVLTDDPEIGHAFHVDAPVLLVDTIQSWLTESARIS